ncbi:MAG TPA: complex I NDUFA9 subunit family protein [Rhodocyclaceae bacterium]|nr:complex I NDUFA9 subunit family protein [Rhodocyclaceae bacterium]
MNVLILGGSGFVGSHLTRLLMPDCHGVTIPCRRRERVRELMVNATTSIVQADIHDDATLARLMHGKDVVINLVGILHGDFKRAHVELPRRVASAALKAGVPRLLHMSALGAAPDAPSQYLRSKAAGEAAIRSVVDAAGNGLNVTIFRPSVIFGDRDSFLNLFGRLQAVAPVLPLACPNAQFQPVWVDDVARAFMASLRRSESYGHAYDLCGPRIYTLRELVAYVGELTGHRRSIIGLPDRLSYLQALVMEWLPGAPMTRDNYYSMQKPNVCAAGCTFPFGITPTVLEAIAPGYLGDDSRQGRLQRYVYRQR